MLIWKITEMRGEKDMDMKIELLPLVDMDGVLTKDERERIIKRLHTILAWVGSRIPQDQVICGETLNLREAVIRLISRDSYSKEDIEWANYLAECLTEREQNLEKEIIHGDISEDEALELLEEARGLLRAIDELENLEDRNKRLEAKDTLLAQVDDEMRWKHYIDKLKK
jgi:beta-phosphoglucomutase-like phosphatase (HAD superfamily)